MLATARIDEVKRAFGYVLDGPELRYGDHEALE